MLPITHGVVAQASAGLSVIDIYNAGTQSDYFDLPNSQSAGGPAPWTYAPQAFPIWAFPANSVAWQSSVLYFRVTARQENFNTRTWIWLDMSKYPNGGISGFLNDYGTIRVRMRTNYHSDTNLRQALWRFQTQQIYNTGITFNSSIFRLNNFNLSPNNVFYTIPSGGWTAFAWREFDIPTTPQFDWRYLMIGIGIQTANTSFTRLGQAEISHIEAIPR